MADAGDSKSPGGNPVRVRLPPRACIQIFSLVGLALACGSPTPNSVVPEPLQQTVILTDPPGAIIVVGAETLATLSPVVARYHHPESDGIALPLRIHALPTNPGECPQFVYIAAKALGPDTVRFSMNRCPKTDQDLGVLGVDSVEEPPERLRGPMPDPEYLMRSGKPGLVMVGVIIDTSGHAEPHSIEIVCASDPGFIISARGTVLGSVFTPGRIYGRKVRVRVHIPIQYSLARGVEEHPTCLRM